MQARTTAAAPAVVAADHLRPDTPGSSRSCSQRAAWPARLLHRHQVAALVVALAAVVAAAPCPLPSQGLIMSWVCNTNGVSKIMWPTLCGCMRLGRRGFHSIYQTLAVGSANH